jgi:hypothetical protein
VVALLAFKLSRGAGSLLFVKRATRLIPLHAQQLGLRGDMKLLIKQGRPFLGSIQVFDYSIQDVSIGISSLTDVLSNRYAYRKANFLYKNLNDFNRFKSKTRGSWTPLITFYAQQSLIFGCMGKDRQGNCLVLPRFLNLRKQCILLPRMNNE